MDQKSKSPFARIVLLVILPAAFFIWYYWPSVTVPEVQEKLQQDLPIGTSRWKTEEWFKKNRIAYSYSKDFRNDSILEDNQIKPGMYSGIIRALVKNTDRDLIVSGSIQIYILFDRNDLVAMHIVRWMGMGP
jgi:hypothetical protein